VTSTGYLVEAYAPSHQAAVRARTVANARRAAEAMSFQGTPVRYLSSIFIPADETCFHLFEGPSAEAIGEATRRAAIEFDRIVEVLQ
jgi:hypothetical protein